ncbi:radical SAM protein [Acetivibrio cellulolyticus]|uniref:radical SAM protein n=1 Tax=Acetivibrio cellulolyticus TaxID=35830 RepID=UPI0001E300F5|nr:radical SAM protein [Acetivibrio cellulolyticus]
MKLAPKDYIINTVYRTNILPVISACNTSCVFCSHKQNPEGVEVYRLDKLSLADFEEIIEFLSPDRKIIIGESATRIVEGEPLLHKDFIDVVETVRRKYKKTPIQVTTNGILLDENLVERLQELKNIELNVSVNCISEKKRMAILGLKKQDNIKEKLALLEGRINYSASAVFDPNFMNYEDLEEMVAFLDRNGAGSIRLFLPGYTYLTDKNFELDKLYNEVADYSAKLKPKYRIPIIIEPSYIYDLKARIAGVVENSPAFDAGILEGDIIERIENARVATRVEAFNKAFRLKDPELDIIRDDRRIKVRIKKEKNSSPGFIMLYDIDPDEADRIGRVVQRHGADKVLFITSQLAYNVLKGLFEISGFTFMYDIVEANNVFFRGTIKCAGLLTVEDIISSAEKYINEKGRPDLIMLPPIMFDYRGRDLVGRSIGEIEAELGIPVDTP